MLAAGVNMADAAAHEGSFAAARGCFCLVFVIGCRAAAKHKPSALEGFIHAALLVQPADDCRCVVGDVDGRALVAA